MFYPIYKISIFRHALLTNINDANLIDAKNKRKRNVKINEESKKNSVSTKERINKLKKSVLKTN